MENQTRFENWTAWPTRTVLNLPETARRARTCEPFPTARIADAIPSVFALASGFFLPSDSFSLLGGGRQAMGKYMKKAKITGEVAVMDLTQSSFGVRTRAKTLALQRLQKSTSASSASYLELRSRRLEKPLIAEHPKKLKENPSPGLVACCRTSGSAASALRSCSDKDGGAVAPASAAKEGPLNECSSENEVAAEVSFGENVSETEGRERWVFLPSHPSARV
ncbi:hypothetical protein ACLOJK_011312 [Asimina triloba]